MLLENGSLLKEERENARKLTREIKGFGSFSNKTTSQHTESTFGRSHSQFNEHGNEHNFDKKISFDQPRLIILGKDNVNDEKPRIVKRILKENKAPKNDIWKGDLHVWKINLEEKNSLLDEQNGGLLIEDDEHPFNDNVEHSRMSLLAAAKHD